MNSPNSLDFIVSFELVSWTMSGLKITSRPNSDLGGTWNYGGLNEMLSLSQMS